MIFAFVRYKVEATPTIPSGEVCRPLVPLRIYGPKGSVQVFGLLDTGADNVFVASSLAEMLGIDLIGEVESALGAGGHEIDSWPGAVEIEIKQGRESYRWHTTVGFLAGDDDPPIAYLGQAGFLERFNTTFDTENWIVELFPHETFLRST
jgi:hypothetical protein